MLPFLLKPLSHLTAAESIVRDVLQRLPIPVLSARFSESAEENGSSPGAWCTSSSRDSSTGWVRRSVPLGWPPVLSVSCGRLGIC